MFSLAPYRLAIKSLNDSKQVPLWDKEGKGFATWLHKYLSDKLGKIETRPEKRIARVSKICTNADYTFLCGLLQTGKYGYRAELVNTKNSNVSHERSVAEAEMVPFFFSLTIPMQSEWGVLILQKFQNFGIFESLIPTLRSDFNKEFNGFKLDVDRLVPQTLAKALLKDAEVKALRFISYKMPKAVEDALGQYNLEDNMSTTEVVIKAKRKEALPKIGGFMDVLNGTKILSKVVTMAEWDYNNVKLDLEVGGRKRTIDIGKPSKINPTVDITEEVTEGPDGHPVWDDVMKVAANLSKDFLKIQYPGVEVDTKLTHSVDAPKISPAIIPAAQVAA